MKAAKISYWNNKWSDIFDFTPSRGGGGKGVKNYTLSYEPMPGFVSSLE